MPKSQPPRALLSAAQVNALMDRAYPQLNAAARCYFILDVFDGGCRARLDADDRHLRPGGTVSGPSLFTLADIGGYGCALSHAGGDALAVTTNLDINFMRKAGPGPVDAQCRILKLGRSLMVFSCEIFSPAGELAAFATGTYSIPPRQAAK
ncbi:MAG: PaaI family thioesterase [Rhizobiaceae bacterium]